MGHYIWDLFGSTSEFILALQPNKAYLYRICNSCITAEISGLIFVLFLNATMMFWREEKGNFSFFYQITPPETTTLRILGTQFCYGRKTKIMESLWEKIVPQISSAVWYFARGHKILKTRTLLHWILTIYLHMNPGIKTRPLPAENYTYIQKITADAVQNKENTSLSSTNQTN